MITNERPCGLPVVMLAFLIAMFSSKTVLSGDTRKTQSIIKNDTRYVDTDGKELALGDGGQITKIDGVYYWVGNEPDKTHGCDIHMYSSRTMENGSWKHEGKIWDFPDGQYGGNCNLVFCPNTKNYVIIAKGLHFLESSTVTGPYKLARKLIGQNTPRKWGFGGLSVYREGNEAYLISSRHTKTVKPPLNRFFGIYRLTPDFLNIETELCGRILRTGKLHGL